MFDFKLVEMSFKKKGKKEQGGGVKLIKVEDLLVR